MSNNIAKNLANNASDNANAAQAEADIAINIVNAIVSKSLAAALNTQNNALLDEVNTQNILENTQIELNNAITAAAIKPYALDIQAHVISANAYANSAEHYAVQAQNYADDTINTTVYSQIQLIADNVQNIANNSRANINAIQAIADTANAVFLNQANAELATSQQQVQAAVDAVHVQAQKVSLARNQAKNAVAMDRDLCINMNNHQNTTFYQLGNYIKTCKSLAGTGFNIIANSTKISTLLIIHIYAKVSYYKTKNP